MKVRKYRDEVSQREAENRTIHNEIASQQRHTATQGHHPQVPAARRTPPSSRPASAGRARPPIHNTTGQTPKTASESPPNQWTRGRDPWSASRPLGGDMEFDLITRNQYQISRELADYERTKRGEPPLGSPEAFVSTPRTPGIHLGREYNAGYIPPASLSQTQRNIKMSTSNQVRTQHYRTHTPSPSPNSPSGHQGGPDLIPSESCPSSFSQD